MDEKETPRWSARRMYDLGRRVCMGATAKRTALSWSGRRGDGRGEEQRQSLFERTRAVLVALSRELRADQKP